MTACQTAAVVACRVLGLYIAITWLGFLPVWVFQPFSEPSFSWSLLGGALFLALPVALAVGLWSLAPWIAKHMLADVESEQASPSAVTMEEVQAVAISILGILFVVKALPGVVVTILGYFGVPGIAEDVRVQSMLRASTVKAAVMHVTEIGLGTWLFLGARSFVRVFQRFYSPNAS
jgi:hypothetical protein